MKNKNALIETVNRFLIRTTVILTVFFVLSGIVTVRQRAGETSMGESYSDASFVDSDSEIGLRLGGKYLTVKKQTVKELEEYIKRLKTLISMYG
ncbi:MAG: hypothetical protein ACI4SB_04455 [Acutalibacteraceae bacterium]